MCCWDKRKQRKEDSNQRRNGNVNRVSVDRLSEVYQIWIRERIAINPPQAPCWSSSHNRSHAWGKDLPLTGNLPESAPPQPFSSASCFPLKASFDLWKMLSCQDWKVLMSAPTQDAPSLPVNAFSLSSCPSYSQTQQRFPVCGDNAQSLKIGWKPLIHFSSVPQQVPKCGNLSLDSIFLKVFKNLHMH